MSQHSSFLLYPAKNPKNSQTAKNPKNSLNNHTYFFYFIYLCLDIYILYIIFFSISIYILLIYFISNMYSLLLQKPYKNFRPFFWGRDGRDFSHFSYPTPHRFFFLSLIQNIEKIVYIAYLTDYQRQMTYQIAYFSKKSRTKPQNRVPKTPLSNKNL